MNLFLKELKNDRVEKYIESLKVTTFKEWENFMKKGELTYYPISNKILNKNNENQDFLEKLKIFHEESRKDNSFLKKFEYYCDFAAKVLFMKHHFHLSENELIEIFGKSKFIFISDILIKLYFAK